MEIRLERTTFGDAAEHEFHFRIEPDPLGDGIELVVLVSHVDGLEAQWDEAYSVLATTLDSAATEARRLHAQRRDAARSRGQLG